MKESAKFDPSEFNAADITAIALMFISLALGMVGAARDARTLTLIAPVVALPAAILKVGSTRAKSRRWHQHRASREAAEEKDAAK